MTHPIKPIAASTETHFGKPPKPPVVKPAVKIHVRPAVHVKVYVTSHGVHAVAEIQTPAGPAHITAIVPLKPYLRKLHQLLQNPRKSQALLRKLHQWGDKKWIFGPPGHKHSTHSTQGTLTGAEPYTVDGLFSTDGDEFLTEGFFSSLKKAAMGAIPGAQQIAQGAAMIAKNKAVKDVLKKTKKALNNPLVAKSLNLAATIVPGGSTAMGLAKMTADLTQKALLGDKKAHNKIAKINATLKAHARVNPKAKNALKILTKVSAKVAEKAPVNPLRGMKPEEMKFAKKVAKASPAAKKALEHRHEYKQAHKASKIEAHKAAHGDIAKPPCKCLPAGYHIERDRPGVTYPPSSKRIPTHAAHAARPMPAVHATHPPVHAAHHPQLPAHAHRPVPRLTGPANEPLLPGVGTPRPSEPLLPGVGTPKRHPHPKPKVADGSKTPWFLRKPIAVSQTPAPAPVPPAVATHGDYEFAGDDEIGDHWGYEIGAFIPLPPPPALLAAQGYNAAQAVAQHIDNPNQSANGAQVLASSMGIRRPISQLARVA